MKTAFTTECHVYFTCCPTSRGARETRRSVLDARKGPTIIIDSWWLTTLHQLKMHHLKKIKKIWFHPGIFPYRVQANTNEIETTSISLIIHLLLVGLQGHNEIQRKKQRNLKVVYVGFGGSDAANFSASLAASRRLVVFSEPNLQRITINCDKSGHIKKWHSQHWCNYSDTSQKKAITFTPKEPFLGLRSLLESRLQNTWIVFLQRKPAPKKNGSCVYRAPPVNVPNAPCAQASPRR